MYRVAVAANHPESPIHFPLRGGGVAPYSAYTAKSLAPVQGVKNRFPLPSLFAYHLLTICLPFAYHLLIICLPFADHLLTICLPFSYHVLSYHGLSRA